MSFEEKFDKILRQRMGEAEFPFDEGNWDKASRMIDGQRGAAAGAKSSKYFLLFGALFLVIAGITFFSMTMNSGSADKNMMAENNTGASSNQTVAGDVQNNADQNTSVSNSNNNSNNSNISNTQNSSASNSNGNNGAGNEAVNAAASVNNNQNKGSDHVSALDAGAGEMSANRNEVAGTVNAPGSVEKNNPGSINEGKGQGNVKTGSAKSSLGKTISIKHDDNKVANKKGNAANGKRKKAAEKAIVDPEVLNASLANSKQEENAEVLEMRSSVLQIWNKDAMLKRSAYDFIRVYDNDYFTKHRRKTHFLNAELGTTYLFGWETANGRDAKGFNAFGGLNYGIYLSKRTSASVGVQLYNVGNIKQAFYSKANYEYDFGSNGNYTNITTNAVYYFSIPLKAYYNIPRTNSRVGLGVNTGLAFNGKSTVQTYTERDKVKSNIVETKQKGYYEGVNDVNILVSAFYNYRVSRRMILNGEVVYGLSDTYKNSISNTNTRENNLGLKLSLQYTLFDK